VIITRTPLRISLGGGGTDLPSYYEQDGGFVLSAAINKYIYISINRTFTNDFLLKYSELERVQSIGAVSHPIIRTACEMMDIKPGVEIVSVADIPAGTGLGSSGTFTVGLLHALSVYKHLHTSVHELAEMACHIEIEMLSEPVGKQDQFIAAYGGITNLEFGADGTVRVSPLTISAHTLTDLESNLLLFFTGYSRSASSILKDQAEKSVKGDLEMRKNLDETRLLGLRIKEELINGNALAFGELMDEHWQRKKKRTVGMSNQHIDELYEIGRNNGAIGGKLVGAGAGGFLLFYADQPQLLRDKFRSLGLEEVPFHFDHDGTTLLARS
jgi:D-glycero-alpha-D-manno-heptose-7-phosphate kinase